MCMDILPPHMFTTFIRAPKSQKGAPDLVGLEVQMSVSCDVFRMELGSSGRADSLCAFLGNAFLVAFLQSN